MTATKTVGAFCAALLILLLGQWVATAVYQVGDAAHAGEHSESVIFAYLIEDVEEEEEDVVEVDFASLLDMADAGKGLKVFAKCKACHKVDEETNGVGPHLVAVLGREIGAISEFRYSNPMAELGGVWDVDELSAFIANPKSYLPGTKMSFAGLKKDEDRANLIAYLQSLQN